MMPGLRKVETLFFLAGCLVFGGLVYKVGASSVLHQVSQLGWVLAPIFCVQVLALVANARGWHHTLPPHDRRIPLRTLAGMRLAGDAISYVTPPVALGGELIRIRLLSRIRSMSLAVASVSLSTIAEFLGQILFVIAAVPFFVGVVSEHHLGGTVAVMVTVVAAMLAALVHLVRRGDGFQRLRGMVARWGILDIERRLPVAAACDLDAHVFGFLRNHVGEFACSVALFFIGWGVGALEGYVILRLLHVPATWSLALSIEALSVLIETSLFFVPARVGTQEGGKYVIFLALGLDPALGLVFGIIRRLRELVWTFAGLALLAAYRRRELPVEVAV